jgi:amidase
METDSSSITSLSAVDLSKAIKNRQFKCTEVMEAYLDRIEKLNLTYNAIVALADRLDLLDQSKAADAALDKGEYWGWMHGFPHAVKDLADAKGFVTTRGLTVAPKIPAPHDSIFVERIRNAGAIIIGKTNVPEMGFGSQSYNRVYGTTLNAYDTNLTSGGSSGGAAVGLATHMLPVADGSDMMGSLRNPAAWNNVIGFRPSLGRIPSDADDVFYHQLASNGPMGRNVADTIKLFETMAGFDRRDPLSRRDIVDTPSAPTDNPFKNNRIGWLGDYSGYLPTEPGLLKLCEENILHLEESGATVEDCVPEYSMETLWQTWLTFRHWIISGKAKPLYDNEAWRAELKPEIVWEIEGGLNITGEDVSQAGVARTHWYHALMKLFGQYDFLALPSAQVFPFAADTHWPKEINGKKMDTYHRWMEVTIGASLAGCPVINLPAGFDDQGRPMGIQFIAPIGEDGKLLEFALAYEAHTDHLTQRPVIDSSGSNDTAQ